MRLLRIPSDSNTPTPLRDWQVALVRLDMPDSLELWSELPAAMLLAVQIYDRVVRSSVSVPPGIASCIIPSNMHYTTHNAATTASFDRRSWGLRRPVLHPLPHSRFMLRTAPLRAFCLRCSASTATCASRAPRSSPSRSHAHATRCASRCCCRWICSTLPGRVEQRTDDRISHACLSRSATVSEYAAVRRRACAGVN